MISLPIIIFPNIRLSYLFWLIGHVVGFIGDFYECFVTKETTLFLRMTRFPRQPDLIDHRSCLP
jgi:hypothetical protein